MELVVKRKVTKLVKTWAPVLLLMGLLIAVDSLDSVQGESFLNKMKLSVGGSRKPSNCVDFRGALIS